MRQPAPAQRWRDRQLVRTYAHVYPAGARVPEHAHADHAQLVYVAQGVLTVRAGGERWVVPTGRAVWVPPGERHGLEAAGRVAAKHLYLPRRLAAVLPARCRVVHVSPLLRELVLELADGEPLRASVPRERRAIAFLVDQIATVPVVPLTLSFPEDPRARRLADVLQASPEDRAGVDLLARRAGASRRTLERLFAAETGLTIGRWRQQARLLRALELLGERRSVSEVAPAVGYDSPSAFIAMFTAALGTTPSRYFKTDARVEVETVDGRAQVFAVATGRRTSSDP
jgi:AraC-like DNA-binding protein